MAEVIPSASSAVDAGAWTEVVSKQYMDRVLPEHQTSLLGGIQLRPKNLRFATQNKGEKVYILLRRHWVTNFGWLSSAVFWSFIPPLVLMGVDLVLRFSVVDFLGVKLFTVLALTFYGVLITFCLRKYLDWYFNVYIVTNERVIDYDVKVDVVTRGASELTLDNIEEVREESVGVIASLLNMGTVQVFSAANKKVITFQNVGRPTFVRDIIADLAKLIRDVKDEP